MAGWGKYPYAQGPWAESLGSGLFLLEDILISESLSVEVPIQVVGAVALNSTLVQVEFSQDLDYGYAPILDTSNYGIVPTLPVNSVVAGPTSNTVRLSTDSQIEPLYTLTVDLAKSAAGDTLDPAHKTAIFSSYGLAPTLRATALSRTKIQLVFSMEMLQNPAFTDPSSYTVTDLNLNPVSVVSASIYGPSPVQRLTLGLGSEMIPGGYYVVTVVNSNVKALIGLNLNPAYDLLCWKETHIPSDVSPLSIGINQFSGEVSGGLLGQPLGQVFFSPALEAAIANSSIQIDSVSCCTRAYDVYTIPSLPDPYPLMTFGPEQTYSSVIGGGGNVLWAPAERLGLARFELADFQEETTAQAVDGPADAILQETFDQSRVSLLNVGDWVLFDGVGTSFATADNLTPIPAGTTTNINLQP